MSLATNLFLSNGAYTLKLCGSVQPLQSSLQPTEKESNAKIREGKKDKVRLCKGRTVGVKLQTQLHTLSSLHIA